MSNPIGSLVPGINELQQNQLGGGSNGAKPFQQQQGSSAFESVLQRDGTTPSSPEASGVSGATGINAPSGVSGSTIERLRIELMERLGPIEPGAKKGSALHHDMIDPHSRLTLLREAMQGKGSVPQGIDMKGTFGQVEREWGEVERILHSNNELSTGELLGLQARLYQVSQHIEVMSKVVDQMTSGVKSILNTNI
ncbi:MAG: hypothetical protein H0W76_16025 [Pyrinomonadaceae bacterium]|nr:hypothetical protein [Pyrinomonadaceae bacterium]